LTFHLQHLSAQPDLLWLHQRSPEDYPFLLESCVQGTPQARFDILFGCPQQRLWLDCDGQLGASGGLELADDFLSSLDLWYAKEQCAPCEFRARGLPFHGGWFLFLGYELASQIEPMVPAQSSPSNFPRAFAVRCPAALVWDHAIGEGYAIAEDKRMLPKLLKDSAAQGEIQQLPKLGPVAEEAPQEFLDSLDRIHEFILAGDVFQVNLSREWSVTEHAEPSSVYAALRQSNPAPFAGIARWSDSAVVSSSPERLVEVRDRMIQTRPIAGTRARIDRQCDEQRRQELLAHPKERAEHIMLIDLERNDLGRVCEPGSVEVDELMVVESYAHVHHIVSNVRGRIRKLTTPGEVIRATFPGGTITGCPKVRCMQIIAELEGQTRGPYTGSMGYLNRDGSLDTNILIRSMLVEPERISFRAGAGIVVDSVALAELEETRSKAKGMLLALGANNPSELRGLS